MSIELEWRRDELFLGATKLADVRPDTEHYDAYLWRYVSEPDGHVSEPYESKEDAKSDCHDHVRRLLRKAGSS